MEAKGKTLFEDISVPRAILRLALPTILSQIILVIYNMADTFFIGMADSDVKLSAVTISMPAFMLLTAVSNLFGVGGAATISRANGAGKRKDAKNASGFAFYGCLLVTGLYSLFVFLCIDPFVNMLGGLNPAMHKEAATYLLVTVAAGGIFTSMNTLLSHLIRSEGRSFSAGFGIMFGSLLNIALDPLFMFVIMQPGEEVRAVAFATALSNGVATVYYIIVLIRMRKETVLSFRWNSAVLRDGTASEILATGLPACLMTLMENISYAILGRLMANAGVAYQAGIGVAKKINMLAHCMTRGMTQGVLPLIAYNYSHRNYKRMKQAIVLSSTFSVLLSAGCMLVCLLLTRPLVQVFIERGSSLSYGVYFLRVLCLGGPFSAFAYAIISFLQAVKESRKSFTLAMLRKGVVDIPMMFAIFRLFGARWIVWATPVTDMICCAVAVFIFLHVLRRIEAGESVAKVVTV